MDEKGIKLSIITVCLNEINGIQRTIDSIINQTWQNFEWIVVDGGSNDGTFEKLLEYRSFINNLLTGKDKGIYHAMNKGIKLSHGQYLLFLNGGDYFVNKNSLLSAYANFNYNADINYCPIIGDNNEQFTIPNQINVQFLYKSSMPHGGSFIKHKLFEKKKYDESFQIAADYDFFVWAVLKQKVKIHLLSQTPLSVLCQNGISSTSIKQLDIENKIVRNRYFSKFQKWKFDPLMIEKRRHLLMVISHPRYLAGALKRKFYKK